MNQTITTGRVTAQFQHMYTITTESANYTCSVTGKFRHEAESERDYPVIGDFVEFTVREHGQGVIRRLLERRTVLSRAAAGNETREQLICANVDYILITMACGHDFNLRRLERYSLAAWETGATPLIVLTKSDQVDNAEALVDELALTVPGVDVFPVSSLTGKGVEALRAALPSESTIVLVGSSGVGKSSLTNALAGETVAETQAVRESDERGKHTTTHRELFRIDDLFVIDTPGMREFGLWDGADHLDETFRDIEALAETCRFRDCAHGNEPGCAVRSAIISGTLDAKRYQSFVKLERELRYAEKRQAETARLAEKKKRKTKA
ncbi:ribosome small subunit-dependent GTPase A [Exiguobacterium sp. TNDT2]|uniref:ribosome small subunit-dependent GTPase A n=1 Tax=Exiguobacterium sp. TNDT2 TaxID=2233531 RepID=UPI000DEF4889|nr:ribosome small subunit-dependent GTPase A [Exiguobacterium sp. TNDT2]